MLYIGSAPCVHFPILLYLYPKLTWILCDPNRFNIINNGQVGNRKLFRSYDFKTKKFIDYKQSLPVNDVYLKEYEA